MDDAWGTIGQIVTWLDTNSTLPPDNERRLRIMKLAEETGEVTQAVIGTLGQNPRKGVTHTWDRATEVHGITPRRKVTRRRPATPSRPGSASRSRSASASASMSLSRSAWASASASHSPSAGSSETLRRPARALVSLSRPALVRRQYRSAWASPTGNQSAATAPRRQSTSAWASLWAWVSASAWASV